MPRFNAHALVIGAAASLAMLLPSTTATAALGDVELSIQVDDLFGFDETFTSSGTDNGGGEYNHNDNRTGPGWSISWDFDSTPDMANGPGGFAQLGSGFSIQNDTDDALEIHIRATMTLAQALSNVTTWAGGTSLTLTGTDGMLIAPNAGEAIWESQLNGVDLNPAPNANPGGLWYNPSSVSFTGNSSASTSGNVFGTDAGAASTIGIELNLLLSAGEALTFTGNFNVTGVPTTPAPGAFALLGLGLLTGGRRRRG